MIYTVYIYIWSRVPCSHPPMGWGGVWCPCGGVYTYIHTYTYLYMYVRMYIHMYVRTCTCTCTLHYITLHYITCTCTYIHTNIPTYQHTNIPTYHHHRPQGGGPEEPYHHHRPQGGVLEEPYHHHRPQGGGDQKNHTTTTGHRGGGDQKNQTILSTHTHWWGGRGVANAAPYILWLMTKSSIDPWFCWIIYG